MAFSLKDDQRAQQRVLGSAAAAVGAAIKSLPGATLPSLEGLAVKVPVRRPSADDVKLALLAKLRAHAEVTPRDLGDEVAEGDEVKLTIVGYDKGTMVPGIARTDVTMLLPDDSVFVGLSEELLGVPVGATHAFEAELGAFFEIASLRGKRVTLGVRVHAASAVVLPAADDDAFWQRVGFAATAQEAVQKVAHELVDEVEAMAPLLATRAILAEIAKGATVEVPAELVDTELSRRWREGEGEALTAMAVDMDEQSQSLRAYVALPDLRAAATEQLRILCVAKALVAHYGLQVSQEAADVLWKDLADAEGKSYQQFGAELAQDKKRITEYEDLAIRKLLMEKLLATFAVEVVEVP